MYSDAEVDDTHDADLRLSIDDSLFLETFLMHVRGQSISYSSFLKKSRNEKYKELEENISHLEGEVRNNFQNGNEALLSKLSIQKKELEKLKEEEIKGVQIRNRIQWYEEGEKPTNYFCHLESRNYSNKLINSPIAEKK